MKIIDVTLTSPMLPKKAKLNAGCNIVTNAILHKNWVND